MLLSNWFVVAFETIFFLLKCFLDECFPIDLKKTFNNCPVDLTQYPKIFLGKYYSNFTVLDNFAAKW